jgi:uroporphyrinogen-III synthase
MRIWVTRAAPQAEATGLRLRRLGHAPLIAPLLEVRPIRDPKPELKGVGALAFTSRHGVAAFAGMSKVRGLPVFTVGDATARAAREAGFATVRSARGDVESLASLISASSDFSGELLHPSAREPAGDLVGALAAQGVKARRHAVYATEPVEPHLAAAAALKAEPIELDAVLVHSPKAARRLADLDLVTRVAHELEVFCISDAAAEPLRGLNFRRIAVATAPDERALLDLIER